jgi:DNA-binding response OmpR family regulator
MLSVLIVEDDKDLGRVLSEQFTAAGYRFVLCPDVKTFKAVKASEYSAAVVDLNLPDGSGFDILKSLSIPTIIMTALNTPENRLEGLELGAHDFIPKPFLFKELQMKLERLLSQRSRQITLDNGSTVDLVGRTIEDAGGTVFLNDKEYRILNFLIDKAPTVVSRDDILNHLQGDDSASHRSIDNVVVKLRQMLRDEEHRYIKSVRGVGYQWVGGKA